MATDGWPSARVDGLIVQPLPPDEVLVYDTERHKAHCLNKSAALVWQTCDGRTSIEEIAESLQREMGIASREAAQDAVWVALDRLSRRHLLQETVTPPALAQGISRREFVRRAAIAVAIGLPVVASITAQPAGAQATCRPCGASCNANSQCCSGLCRNPGTQSCSGGNPNCKCA